MTFTRQGNWWPIYLVICFWYNEDSERSSGADAPGSIEQMIRTLNTVARKE